MRNLIFQTTMFKSLGSAKNKRIRMIRKKNFLNSNYIVPWIINLIILITCVRFNKNFPITNMQCGAFTRLITVKIFSTGRFHTCWKALDRWWWEALTGAGTFPVGWQEKMAKWFIQSMMTRFGLSSKSCDKLIMII